MKVDLIDYMGDDLTVVNAARVSFDKASYWGNFENGDTPGLSEKDTKLTKYLASHGHFTPFTHCTITLRETVPIFVARQRFKHVVGFSYNEVSRRYVDDEPTFYMPDKWRKKAENRKQGSSDEEVSELNYSQGFTKRNVSEAYRSFLSHAELLYNDMLEAGVAPEQARMVLPQSMYTSYYVTGSLYAFARAYNLRSKEDAQKEIRDLAEMWDPIIKELYPVSWEMLTKDGS